MRAADHPADRPALPAGGAAGRLARRTPAAGGAGAAEAALPRAEEGPVALLVGPEGGFAPEEVRALLAHPAVRPIGLGPRVLRAETACLAGVALLQGPGCG